MSATPNTTTDFPSLAKKIWIFAIIRGVLGIIFGLIALFAPIATAVVLAIVIGAWAIVVGVLQIVASIRHRAVSNSGWVWGIIGGALAILFGILVLIRPGTGLVSIIWIIGIWAIVWGITLIVLGVQLRKAANTTEAST